MNQPRYNIALIWDVKNMKKAVFSSSNSMSCYRCAFCLQIIHIFENRVAEQHFQPRTQARGGTFSWFFDMPCICARRGGRQATSQQLARGRRRTMVKNLQIDVQSSEPSALVQCS
jgi:hypothetical protein